MIPDPSKFRSIKCLRARYSARRNPPTDQSREASALACLKPALGLVDDVDATFAPNDPVVAMATAQGFQRVADFHGINPCARVRAVFAIIGADHRQRARRRQSPMASAPRPATARAPSPAPLRRFERRR